MVVYDNACNLQRYALRRAPPFFKDTAFCIDRLHIFNHHGYALSTARIVAHWHSKAMTHIVEHICRCSKGYNLSIYPQDMEISTGVQLSKLLSRSTLSWKEYERRCAIIVRSFHNACVHARQMHAAAHSTGGQ